MAALHALPGVARVVVRHRRVAADGGRVQQHLGALQRHAPRALREPLVPADADADARVGGVPDAEAGVAGREVVLLLVAAGVGDVALAVDAEERAVGVDDRPRS